METGRKVCFGLLVIFSCLVLWVVAGSVYETAEDASRNVLYTVASEQVTQLDHGNVIYTGLGMVKCVSGLHAVVRSTEEVREVVEKLYRGGGEVKVRVTRRDAHTPNSFACPGISRTTKLPYDGDLEREDISKVSPGSVTVLMHLMNKVLEVDEHRLRITVEAGMTVQGLADAAVENGMSVPVGALPVYGNLSLSGVIAASGHGTGAGTISSLADLVTKITWVNGKGELITSDMEDEKGLLEMRALLGGLGLLGIMTQVTFQLLPPGALAHVETRNELDDANMVAEIRHDLEADTPHILTFWRPDLHQYRQFLYKPVPQEYQDTIRHGGEIRNYPPFHPSGRGAILDPLPDILAEAVKQQGAAYNMDWDESSPNSDALNVAACELSKTVLQFPPFNDGKEYLQNATIPSTYAMIAPECFPKCFHNSKHVGSTLEDNEFTIKLSQLDDWVQDVKTIMKKDMESKQQYLDSRYGSGTVKICLPSGFFWIRYGKGTQNLLASTAAIDGPVAYVMHTFMNSLLTPHVPSKGDSIFQAIEQLNLCKYRARAHWGKNFNRQFVHPKCPLLDNFPEENIAKLLELQQQHDPLKLYEPEHFTRMLKRAGPIYSPKCALKRDCYCKEDTHCATGFRCKPSSAFPEYKICKVEFPTIPDDYREHDEF